MSEQRTGTYAAFLDRRMIAAGPIDVVVLEAKRRHDAGDPGRLVIYRDATGEAIDIDYRGTPEESLARLADHPVLPRGEKDALRPRGPGRPRLGVVAREVTLLPRHWEWLRGQRGGASATLRRLVEDASRASRGEDLAREAIEAAHRFMWDMAGDLPRFEEASRALFARDMDALERTIDGWPTDVAGYLLHLARRAAAPETERPVG